MKQQPRIIAFAVVASLLIVTTAPIAGAATGDTLVVGSKHTTNTDFQNSQTLTNLSVTSDGNGAVTLQPGSVFSDSFEDEPADSGVPESWDVDLSMDSINVDDSVAFDGSQSVYISKGGSGGRIQPQSQPYASSKTNPISVAVRGSYGQNRIRLFENGANIANVAIRDGDLKYYDGSWNTISTAPDYNEWVSLTLTIKPSSDELIVEWSEPGGASGSSPVPLINPSTDGYDRTTIGVYKGAAYFDDFSIGGQPFTDGIYVGATHNVDNAKQAEINITEASNVSYDVTPQYYDGQDWVNDSTTTYSTTGEKSISLTSASSSQWRVRVDVSSTGDNPAWTMADESIWFTDNPASAANPNLSGGTQVNNENVDLSVDISDPQFPTAQGDSVTVNIYVDGNLIDTQTSTSNQTVATTATGLSDGNHTWHIELEDDYGVTATSSTWNFEVVHKAPTISNLSPNTTETNNENVALSFDLADYDFAEDSGDSINATLHLNGAVENTWTGVASNQTLSHTVTGLTDGQHDWYVITEDEYGLTTVSSNASFTVRHYAPVINNTSMNPTGKIDELTTEFTVSHEDRDYAEPSGDTVTAKLFIEGQSHGTDTLTANGTASVNTTVSTGGENTYYWEFTDEYNNVATSQSETVSTPTTLTIRNETNYTHIISNSNATIEFYFDRDTEPDLIVKRNASSGAIDMTDLPVDENFIIVAKADNYFNRRIYVESLYSSQDIFLLNKSEDAVQPSLVITDFTGNFPLESTIVELQRNINGSWRTVEGDFFGAANQFSPILLFNERHRVIVTNVETGRSRELGVFTPVETSTIVFEVHQDTTIIETDLGPIANFAPGIKSISASKHVLNITVNNRSDRLQNYTVVAKLANGTVLNSTTGYGPSGDTVPLTVNLTKYEGSELNVSVTWYTENGGSGVDHHLYSIRRAFGNTGLVTVLKGIAADQPPGVTGTIALLVTAISVAFAATQMSTAAATGVGVLIFAAFALVSFVPMAIFFLVAIGWVIFTGMRL